MSEARPGPDGFCERLGHPPVIRVALGIDGDTYLRDWCACAPDKPMGLIDGVPGWLGEPLRQWEHPRDPVTYSGVVSGSRDDALAFLYGEVE